MIGGAPKPRRCYCNFRSILSGIPRRGTSWPPPASSHSCHVALLPAVFSTNAAWQAFLGDHAPPSVTEVDEGLLRAILARALTMDPIAVGQIPLVPVEVYSISSQPNLRTVRPIRARAACVSASTLPPSPTVPSRSTPAGLLGTRLATGTGVQRIPIVDIPVGAYRVRALVEGYERRRVKGVVVRVSQISDLTINLQPLTTPRIDIVEKDADRFDAPLRRWRIAGVDEATIAELERVHIRTVGQLASADPQLVSLALGHSLKYSRSLIDDARRALDEIKARRAYYEGVDEHVAAALSKLGLTDDVALANADHTALAKEVGQGPRDSPARTGARDRAEGELAA